MAKSVTKGQLGSCLERVAGYFLQMNEDFSGASANAAGAKGMVPAPSSGKQGTFLRGDGTWADPVIISSSTPSNTQAIWFKTTAPAEQEES